MAVQVLVTRRSGTMVQKQLHGGGIAVGSAPLMQLFDVKKQSPPCALAVQFPFPWSLAGNLEIHSSSSPFVSEAKGRHMPIQWPNIQCPMHKEQSPQEAAP